jgi:hypothetical protein
MRCKGKQFVTLGNAEQLYCLCISVFFQGLHISVYTTFNLASWVGKKDVGEGKGIGYGKANVEECHHHQLKSWLL